MDNQNQKQMVTRQPLEFGTLSANLTGNPVVDIFLCPERFEQMQRGANLLASSKIVPAHYQSNPGGCFIAMNIALQLGVEPFSFMQKTYIIGGKLGIEAQVAIAVANQRKVFKEPLKYTFTGEYGKNPTRKCVCTGILSANGATVEMPLTWGEVDAEGWNKKGGSKWMSIPDQMFRYRTALWLIRTYAPEVLLGLNTVDELEDSNTIDVTPRKDQSGAAAALMSGKDIGGSAENATIVPPTEPAANPAPAAPAPAKTKKADKKKEEQKAETQSAPHAVNFASTPAPEAALATEKTETTEPAKETETPPTESAAPDQEKAPEAEKPKPELTDFEKHVAETMSEFAKPEYSYSEPFSVENGNAVIKALATKAKINDGTLPLMTKSVTDGVMDRNAWTEEHWANVRNMLLSVLKRSAEQAARMALKK